MKLFVLTRKLLYSLPLYEKCTDKPKNIFNKLYYVLHKNTRERAPAALPPPQNVAAMINVISLNSQRLQISVSVVITL